MFNYFQGVNDTAIWCWGHYDNVYNVGNCAQNMKATLKHVQILSVQ